MAGIKRRNFVLGAVVVSCIPSPARGGWNEYTVADYAVWKNYPGFESASRVAFRLRMQQDGLEEMRNYRYESARHAGKFLHVATCEMR